MIRTHMHESIIRKDQEPKKFNSEIDEIKIIFWYGEIAKYSVYNFYPKKKAKAHYFLQVF